MNIVGGPSKPDFRSAVFGMNGMAQIVAVKSPREAEGCGLYVHVDDIQKYLDWQKQFEDEET